MFWDSSALVPTLVPEARSLVTASLLQSDRHVILWSGDALQLAAALSWCDEAPQGDAFVCLDDRLREAARREGFSILPAQ